MLNKNVVKLIFCLVFVIEALQKFFGITDRADDKVAVTNFAAARGIIALAIAIANAGIVRDFAFY